MTNLKQWISDSVGKYKSSTLNADLKYASLCAHNNQTEKRSSICAAMEKEEKLQDLLTDFKTKFEKKDNTPEILAIQALLMHDIGCLKVEHGGNRAALTSLLKSWELVKDISSDPQYCMLALNILNQVSGCFITGKDFRKALSYLKEAECLYHNYKRESSFCPKDVADMFSVGSDKGECWKPFEVAYTITLFHLARSHEFLGEVENAAKYSHLFLIRHKDFMELDKKDWASKVIELSGLYILQKDYATARHLLSCASFVLSNEALSDKKEQVEGKADKLSCIKAHLSHHWAIYCNALATDILINRLKPNIQLKPPRLDVDPVGVMSIEVKAPLSVTTFSDASKAFKFGQEHVEIAKLHYTYSLAPKYYNVLQSCLTVLFGLLIAFEKDLGRQSKMYKRRADIFEDLTSKNSFETNPYEWQRFQYMLGGNYYAYVVVKLQIFKNLPQERREEAASKIKSLFLKGIDCCEKILQSLEDKDGTLPEVFSDNEAEHALPALDVLCKLYKLINSLDLHFVELANYTKPRKYHKFLVDYVKKNPNHRCYVEDNWPVIESMGECFSTVAEFSS